MSLVEKGTGNSLKLAANLDLRKALPCSSPPGPRSLLLPNVASRPVRTHRLQTSDSSQQLPGPCATQPHPHWLPAHPRSSVASAAAPALSPKALPLLWTPQRDREALPWQHVLVIPASFSSKDRLFLPETQALVGKEPALGALAGPEQPLPPKYRGACSSGPAQTPSLSTSYVRPALSYGDRVSARSGGRCNDTTDEAAL